MFGFGKSKQRRGKYGDLIDDGYEAPTRIRRARRRRAAAPSGGLCYVKVGKKGKRGGGRKQCATLTGQSGFGAVAFVKNAQCERQGWSAIRKCTP